MTSLLKKHRLPVQIEGIPYILSGFLLSISGFHVWRASLNIGSPAIWALAVAVLFFIFTGFSIWFYRCPKARVPTDDHLALVSPACGRVLGVDEVSGRDIELDRAKRVSIFMSPVDVHVNRAPIAGVIEKIQYTRGKFFRADLEKASEENEHNRIILKTDLGPRIAFVQIAGFVARRIVCYVNEGCRLSRGERYGMIRFGSRMEVVLPITAEILVHPGEKVIAGETKLARLVK